MDRSSPHDGRSTLDGNREGPTAETAKLAETLSDPLNRLIRYPIARAIVPFVAKTPITPNQITLAHALLGFLGGVFVAFGTRRGLLIGFALCEIRMILDCLDGVLARAKKISSPFGRAMDELADAFAYLSLCGGIFVHVRKINPSYPIGWTLLAMLIVGVFCALTYDFYRRAFSSALTTGKDAIFDDLQGKVLQLRQKPTFFNRFFFWFDWAQVLVLAPSRRLELRTRLGIGKPCDPAAFSEPHELPAQARFVLARANSPRFRFSLRLVSLMTADNIMGILNLSLVSGFLIEVQGFAIAYAIVTLAIGVLASHRFTFGPADARLAIRANPVGDSGLTQPE